MERREMVVRFEGDAGSVELHADRVGAGLRLLVVNEAAEAVFVALSAEAVEAVARQMVQMVEDAARAADAHLT